MAGHHWGQEYTAPGDIQSLEHRNAGSHHLQVTLHESFGQSLVTSKWRLQADPLKGDHRSSSEPLPG